MSVYFETELILEVLNIFLLAQMADYKLDSYRLKAVAAEFLDEDEQKEDLSPKEMFDIFDSKDPARQAVMAHYCVRDTLIPLRLLEKLDKIVNAVGMSKVCCVPLRYLFTRGQTVKVRAPLLFPPFPSRRTVPPPARTARRPPTCARRGPSAA